DADVTAHRDLADHRVDVGAEPGGGDLFLDRPLLGHQVGLGGGRVELHVAGHGGRHVPGRDQAGAGEAQVDRGVLQVGGDAGLALRTEVDVALGLGLALAAVGEVGTDVEVRQPVAHALRRVEVGGQAEAAQLVVHVRDLAVAGAVDGVGQV